MQTAQKVSTNTLYLIRHGENPANLTKEFSYKRIDYPLTAKGVQQAQQSAIFFEDLGINEIYTSPLKRAKQTAEIIAEQLGLPITVVEEFREVNVGDLEDLPPTLENWKFHDSIIHEWYQGNLETRFPGGENYLELLERVQRGLRLVTQHKEDQRMIIAGHGGILTAAVRGLCQNATNEEIDYSLMHNCAITEIELTTAERQLSGNMHAWASYDHLSGEAANLVIGSLSSANQTPNAPLNNP